jgi:glycosyltransferase involved in cell wall biosynthesis
VVCNQLTLRFEAPTELFLFNRATVRRPGGILFRLAQSVTGRMGPFGLWGITTLWVLRAFLRRIEETRPHIVHIHIAQGYEFWLAGLQILLARRRGNRSVLHFHSSHMDDFYDELWPVGRFLFHRFLKLPDVCIALSRSWYNWYRRFIPEDRLLVVPNSIEWDRFQPSPGSPPPVHDTVLFVGVSYARRKGLHDLIAVVPEILAEFPATEFLLVGEDREHFERSLSADATVRAALRFTGDLDPMGVAEAYREATIFTLPAYHEGMPMVLLEAMAAGLPVVCSNANAIPEVITDGVNGFLIEPGDREALADRLLRLLRDRELRRSLGEAACHHIREEHDLAVQARRLEAIYLSLMKRGEDRASIGSAA